MKRRHEVATLSFGASEEAVLLRDEACRRSGPELAMRRVRRDGDHVLMRDGAHMCYRVSSGTRTMCGPKRRQAFRSWNDLLRLHLLGLEDTR